MILTKKKMNMFWGVPPQKNRFWFLILSKNPCWLVDFEHKSSLKLFFELCFEKKVNSLCLKNTAKQKKT